MSDNKINDGGPAFPLIGTHYDVLSIGVTLRDYFAAKAMQGIVSHLDKIEATGRAAGDRCQTRFIAETAYQIADAMIAARNQTNTKD